MSNLELIEVEVVEVESVDHWLDECADEIKTLEWTLQRKTEDVRKRQGEILLDVKSKLGHGHFMEWLRSIGWSDRTARSYMALLKPAKEPKAISPNDEKSAEVAVLEDKPIKQYKDQFFEPEPDSSALYNLIDPSVEVLHELYALPDEPIAEDSKDDSVGEGQGRNIWTREILEMLAKAILDLQGDGSAYWYGKDDNKKALDRALNAYQIWKESS